jgi:hypothetical protein
MSEIKVSKHSLDLRERQQARKRYVLRVLQARQFAALINDNIRKLL